MNKLTTDFETNHKIVKKGQKTFIEVGNALSKIREGKQYKELNYKTFDDYCKTEFNIARSRSYQLMVSAETFENVHHGTQNKAPKNERQLREISKAPKEEQAEVWIKVQKETGKQQPTAKEIKEVMIQNITDVEYEVMPAPKTDGKAELRSRAEKDIKIAAKVLKLKVKFDNPNLIILYKRESDLKGINN